MLEGRAVRLMEGWDGGGAGGELSVALGERESSMLISWEEGDFRWEIVTPRAMPTMAPMRMTAPIMDRMKMGFRFRPRMRRSGGSLAEVVSMLLSRF